MWPTWQLGPGIDIVGWAPPWILGGIECTNCAIVFVFGGFESNGVGCIGNGISIGYFALGKGFKVAFSCFWSMLTAF